MQWLGLMFQRNNKSPSPGQNIVLYHSSMAHTINVQTRITVTYSVLKMETGKPAYHNTVSSLKTGKSNPVNSYNES
jgi:hypothetical protein